MAKKSNKSSQKPKRGTGWMIWLILIVIHSFVVSFITLTLLRTPEGTTRQWLVIFLLIFTAAKAVAALGMWEWKQWGLYLYVIAVLGSMGITLVLTSFLIWGVFWEAIPLLITGWLLRGKQQYFD
jgi:lipoprotein signal peptidase